MTETPERPECRICGKPVIYLGVLDLGTRVTAWFCIRCDRQPVIR